MELGIDRFLFYGKNSPSGLGTNPVPDLLEEIEVADREGLHVFGIGEHHTEEFADSSPAVLLAAAAARTNKIRLSSAITILSVADPVRIMEDFATLDLVSNGRAEIIAGRGAYAEAFALFGNSGSQYDDLYAEKIELLLRLREGRPVFWKGQYRPALQGQTTYPRPVQTILPVWVGATGTPHSFARAGQLGLPIAIGTIGGSFERLRPLVDLYRQSGLRAGHAPHDLRVAVHAIGFLGNTPEDARSDFYPGYHAIFSELGRRAGWPVLTRERFDEITSPDEGLIVGSPEEVKEKLAHIDRVLGGVSRICLQMTVGPLGRESRLQSIRLLGRLSSDLPLATYKSDEA